MTAKSRIAALPAAVNLAHTIALFTRLIGQ